MGQSRNKTGVVFENTMCKSKGWVRVSKSPKIFWSGDYTTIPWEQLPNTYIIKPVSGSSSRGVFVVKDGIDISTNQPINKLEVYNTLKKNAEIKKELLCESLNNINICCCLFIILFLFYKHTILHFIFKIT